MTTSPAPSMSAEVARVCQVLAGEVPDWFEPPDAWRLSQAFAEIRPSALEVEALAAERVLIRTTDEIARRVHQNFHWRFSHACDEFRTESLTPRRTPDGHLLIRDSVLTWAQHFARQFDARHDSIAQRCRRLLLEDRGVTLNAAAAAKALAVERRTLERHFRREIGVSITDYRLKLRVARAIQELQDPNASVDGIALRCGWRSKKGLYAGCRHLTRLGPSELRCLEPERARDLVSGLR